MQYIMTEIQVFTHKTSLKCVTPKLMVILSEMFLTRKKRKKSFSLTGNQTHIRIMIKVSFSTFRTGKDFVFKIKFIWPAWRKTNKLSYTTGKKSLGKTFFTVVISQYARRSSIFWIHLVYPANPTDDIIMNWYRILANWIFTWSFIIWGPKYITSCYYYCNYIYICIK